MRPTVKSLALTLALSLAGGIGWLGGQNPAPAAATPTGGLRAVAPAHQGALAGGIPPESAPAAYAGWHFGLGLGSVSWGDASPCGCGTPRIDVAVAYESDGGLLVEYQLGIQESTNTHLGHALVGGVFPRWLGAQRPIGVFVSGGAVNDIDGFGRRQVGSFEYGYGLRARAPLGRRQNTRVFGELGVVTLRQTFSEDIDWRRITLEERQVHSGVRVRLGVVW